MFSALPGHIIHVAIGIVDKSAAIHGVSTTIDAAADALRGIAGERLVRERNSYLGIARGPELAARISWEVLLPDRAGKAYLCRVHNRRREDMYPVHATQFCGIDGRSGKAHRQQRS